MNSTVDVQDQLFKISFLLLAAHKKAAGVTTQNTLRIKPDFQPPSSDGLKRQAGK